MLLKKGSKGDEVKQLQAALGLTPDGDFGDATEEKVKTWQAEHGLVPDGVVGNRSWAELFEHDKPDDEDEDVIESAFDETTAPRHAEFKLAALHGKIPDAVLAQIPATADTFQITTPLRLAHFLAQCAHESARFKVVSENLNYSASGLRRVFPRAFPNDNLANLYARQPAKIGARVYANRMGNGNEASGDGYRFRGRGYIQLTGKSNYAAFKNFISEDTVAQPDLVADKYPLASAAFFFTKNRIWTQADEGSSEDVVRHVTRLVNGGTNGLSERLSYFKTYYALLN